MSFKEFLVWGSLFAHGCALSVSFTKLCKINSLSKANSAMPNFNPNSRRVIIF